MLKAQCSMFTYTILNQNENYTFIIHINQCISLCLYKIEHKAKVII